MEDATATIFIQLAAYRDPQLEPTLEDLLVLADHPARLRFGICRQYHPGDDFDRLDAYRADDRFTIADVLYTRTKGTCWARHFVQQMYRGEDFTLQIDSHMRFAPGWDTTLIQMVRDLQSDGYPQPLLTAYVPSFDPDNDPAGRVLEPWEMTFDRFIPEGAVFFLPAPIPNWQKLSRPVPARFFSAHMAFTLGAFSTEVQHNPNYYFHGEEISIAARAYTHGYDLFHPHRCVIWHEYTRKGRTKQWEDDDTWTTRNDRSHLTNRRLFGMDGEQQEGHDGPYGFGESRTLAQYEAYAGLRFADRSVQQATLNHLPPPNPGRDDFESDEAYEQSFVAAFRHCIDLHRDGIPARKDVDFFVVAFHAEDDAQLYRRDLRGDELDALYDKEGDFLKIWSDFSATAPPAYWVVWPCLADGNWAERHTGPLIQTTHA